MRSSTWQLGLATGLGILAAVVLSYGTNSNARRATAQQVLGGAQQTGDASAEGQVTKAVAVVHPLGDSKMAGKVVFTQQRGGVEIRAELTGLTPGEHGFHVHEFGDCSMASGECAGGHFNPTGAPHGAPNAEKRHVGDLGNITADESGKAAYHRIDKMIALHGERSIIGRSVIVHAGRDDLTSQPSGDAGARIGCGVIGIADPKMQH